MRTTFSGLPFEIRGTLAWDLREHRRRAMGNRCIGLGPIPFSQVTRAVPIQKARVMPTLARSAELRADQENRRKHG